jgi:Raf kinase inhibitor-like YbhB/YbcL family protein
MGGGIILRRHVNLLVFATTAVIFAQLGCRQFSTLGRSRTTLRLNSPSWSAGEEMPQKFTCDRENVSPTLSWSSPPPNTRSFVLTFSSPHFLVGRFSHWVLYDLPSKTRLLPEAITQQKLPASGARLGQNDLGRIGYYGPCPGFGSSQRYIFHLYALDSELNLPSGETQEQVEAAMRGHILAIGSLSAPYHRPH